MLPKLTHLQFFVLSVLMAGQRSGPYIRDELAKQGQKPSLAAFYQMMARMEEAGLVKGWYEAQHMDGQTVKKRYYEILGSGVKAWEEADRFYADALAQAGRLGLEGA